jgi:hypothetical protein
MAVRVIPNRVSVVQRAVENESAKLVTTNRPRRSMVFSTLVFLGGLSLPLLMAVGVLPVSFLLGFIGIILTGAGGVMLLIFWGEI